MWDRDRKIAASLIGGASAIMLAPLVMNMLGRDIPMVQNLGFAPGQLAPAPAWIAALLVAAAYIAMTFRFVPEVRTYQREVSVFKVVGVVGALASGIMEEVVFRRYLMDWAAAFGVSNIGQILSSGVVFGAAHLVWHSFSRDWRFSLAASVSTTIAGMALAGIYLLGGRNLGPCIAAHFLINLIIEPWLVLAAVSGARKQSGRHRH